MARLGLALYCGGLIVVVVLPIWAASTSALLQWREPVYVVAGFAGIIALSLLLLQPLLASGYLPRLSLVRARYLHKSVGGLLVLMIIAHVAGLWITSPPDVIDALMFVSPTPFSIWGVIAMWGLFASAMLVAVRRKLKLRPTAWRNVHKFLGVVIALGSVIHALLIDGTMETISKWLLCTAIIVAMLIALFRVKPQR